MKRSVFLQMLMAGLIGLAVFSGVFLWSWDLTGGFELGIEVIGVLIFVLSIIGTIMLAIVMIKFPNQPKQ